ncbi:energy transducer TonB [Erythrobacter sp. HL-111]|uniref:energy transducer TonB family protein n=1 Tax=Erythrobacter sp. HL-111 TaxID=1798193 RepID=UPI0006DA036C|nr:TonB family protein [Erythrobacter sp. HL-111]KPP94995.1 MAG: Periplasmic protein TonB [Erythrobacteraceae bacterium HL-111]
MAVAVSGAMFGLLATLGWRDSSGPQGPAMTFLSANEFASEESAAPVEQELREQAASPAPPAPADPPEEAVKEEKPEAAAPAPGPVSRKPVLLLVSGLPRLHETGGAEGRMGRGRQLNLNVAVPSGAPPGDAAPAGAASGGNGDAYGRKVFARIRAHQSYVGELARKGIEGSATLAFTVDSRGRLRDERVKASSGNGRLDQIALGQLREAAPFPAPPQREGRAFTIRLTYRPNRQP